MSSVNAQSAGDEKEQKKTFKEQLDEAASTASPPKDDNANQGGVVDTVVEKGENSYSDVLNRGLNLASKCLSTFRLLARFWVRNTTMRHLRPSPRYPDHPSYLTMPPKSRNF